VRSLFVGRIRPKEFARPIALPDGDAQVDSAMAPGTAKPEHFGRFFLTLHAGVQFESNCYQVRKIPND
jgi:hypothetical protein